MVGLDEELGKSSSESASAGLGGLWVNIKWRDWVKWWVKGEAEGEGETVGSSELVGESVVMNVDSYSHCFVNMGEMFIGTVGPGLKWLHDWSVPLIFLEFPWLQVEEL